MKTGCAGNRLFTLILRLSLVSVPVPPKTIAMPIRRLDVNFEIHSWFFVVISGWVKPWLRLFHLAANPQPFPCRTLSHIRVVLRDS